MFLTQWKNSKRGISAIEILIAVAIIASTLVTLLGLATFSLRVSLLTKETIRAKNIAQEVLEAVRNFRDGTTWDTDGLRTLSTGESNPYYPEKDSSVPPEWNLVVGEEITNGFTRKVIFYNVWRDGDDNIVESGGTYEDSGTKKVKAVVSWQERGKTHQIELITFLTDWQE